MKIKNLIMATVLIPLLSVARTPQGHDTYQLSSKTVKQAQSEDKFVLVVHTSEGSGFDALSNDRYISQFLDKHFLVKKQTNHSKVGSYLIYNEKGELVHRVADEKYPYELAVKIKRGLNINTQYYTLLSRFENGDRSVDLLTNLIVGATDAADHSNAPQFMQAYLETLPTQPSEADFKFVAQHTTQSTDPGFAFLMDHSAGIEKLADIIFQETFVSQVDDRNVDAMQLAEQTKAQYPLDALIKPIDRMSIELLEMREDWNELNHILPAYLSTHNEQLSAAEMDYYTGLLSRYTASR